MRAWFYFYGMDPDQTRIYETHGRAMEPTILDGSFVVVDHTQLDVGSQKVHLVEINGEKLFRRAVNLDGRQWFLRVDSDRAGPMTAYDPETIPILGTAVWVARRV